MAVDAADVARVSGKQDDKGQLEALGKVVRDQRKELGFSQEAFADEAKIDRSHMGKIERGERNVTLLNLLRIATAMKCRASDLLAKAGL